MMMMMMSMPFVQRGYLYCLCYVTFLLFYFHDK